MNSLEKNVFQDTLLSGGLVGAAVVWLIISAVGAGGARDAAPGVRPVAATPATAVMVGTPDAGHRG